MVGNTNEDTTREYTDVGILRIYLDKPANRIIVKTVKDKKEREVTIVEANSLIIDIELGGKRYNIIAEKDLIPYLFVLRDNKEVEVVEGKQTTIKLSPTKLEFTLLFCYFSMLLLTEIIVILCFRKLSAKQLARKK